MQRYFGKIHDDDATATATAAANSIESAKNQKKLKLEDLKNIANSFKGSKHVALQDTEGIQAVFDTQGAFQGDLIEREKAELKKKLLKSTAPSQANAESAADPGLNRPKMMNKFDQVMSFYDIMNHQEIY